MLHTLSQETIEQALRRLAETPQFLEIAQAFRFSEIHLTIQDGQYVSGDIRLKGRAVAVKPRRIRQSSGVRR